MGQELGKGSTGLFSCLTFSQLVLSLESSTLVFFRVASLSRMTSDLCGLGLSQHGGRRTAPLLTWYLASKNEEAETASTQSLGLDPAPCPFPESIDQSIPGKPGFRSGRSGPPLVMWSGTRVQGERLEAAVFGDMLSHCSISLCSSHFHVVLLLIFN